MRWGLLVLMVAIGTGCDSRGARDGGPISMRDARAPDAGPPQPEIDIGGLYRVDSITREEGACTSSGAAVTPRHPFFRLRRSSGWRYEECVDETSCPPGPPQNVQLIPNAMRWTGNEWYGRVCGISGSRPTCDVLSTTTIATVPVPDTVRIRLEGRGGMLSIPEAMCNLDVCPSVHSMPCSLLEVIEGTRIGP